MTIPFHVSLMSKFINVIKFSDDEKEVNEAKGEIIRMDFKDAHKYPFNYQVVGNNHGYDWIWRHIAHNYWKVILKVKEGPWTCQ